MIVFSAFETVFQPHGVWQAIAAAAGAVAAFAQRRATRAPVDPVEDLTERLRHPMRWAWRQPVGNVWRLLRRRRR